MGDTGNTGSSSGSGGSSFLSSVIKFLDIRFIQYPFYLVGFAGVLVIARSVKLSKKFVSTNSIPREFFNKNFTLYGKVEEVKKFDGSEQSIVVFVDHAPILRSRSRTSMTSSSRTDLLKNCLQITVPGIILKELYFPEVYKKLMSQRVAFTLLEAEEAMNSATSLLFVRTTKFKVIPRYENVSFWCVQNGFATTLAIPYPSPLRESKKFNAYYAKLLAFERKAAEKRKGFWADADDSRKQSNFVIRAVKRLFQAWRNR